MPFQPHRRVTYSGIFGTLAAAYEAWSFRLNTTGIQPGGDDLAAIAVGCAAAFSESTAQTGSLRSIIRPHCRLTQVKVADIGADGAYTRGPGIANVDVVGNSNAGTLYPTQIAAAISLTTATRGPAGRGRFYLPAPAVTISDLTGRLSIADAEFLRDGAARFLSTLNAVPGIGAVVIASTSGSAAPVTGLRVGRALDTMRSRRAQLLEEYPTASLVTGST